MKLLHKNKALKRSKTVYYKYGTTPNVIIFGSPTISSAGLINGFSSSNYVMLPKKFSPAEGKVWEMVFKVKTGSAVSSQQQIMGALESQYGGIEFGIKSSKFVLWLGSNVDSYNIANGVTGSLTVAANTWYWVKVAFDGSKYILAYSTNGTSYTTDITVTYSSRIVGAQKSFGLDVYGSNYAWAGYINFAESYIMYNGYIWWNGTVAEEVSGGSYDYTETKTVYLGIN